MRIAFHTLGCKVNQYETEAMKEAFVSRGATIVSEDEAADAYIVNTCTVTNIADRKSRQFIRRMHSQNPDALIVVTGCYAQVAEDALAAMPEVDMIIGNSLKSGIAGMVCEALEKGGAKGRGGNAGEHPVREVLPYEELTGYDDMGIVSAEESSKCRAYIKIEEGCDRFCSYCLIPFARGRVRSRDPEEIAAEAKALISGGCREIVLTGINTALYGTEEGFSFSRMDDEEGLSGLEVIIKRLDALEGDFRIRLSSLEPTVVDAGDVKKLLGYGRLCHHLHLSIQSGSDHVLKLMNRRYDTKEYLEIVKALKDFDPDYGITTDIIAGFPGETGDDHRRTLDLIGKAGFGRVHVFRFSSRAGTAAAKMDGKVDGDTKARRGAELQKAADSAFEVFVRQNMGRTHRFLAEERAGGYVSGYTDNYIRTYVKDEKEEIVTGGFCNVRITGMMRDGVIAVVAHD